MQLSSAPGQWRRAWRGCRLRLHGEERSPWPSQAVSMDDEATEHQLHLLLKLRVGAGVDLARHRWHELRRRLVLLVASRHDPGVQGQRLHEPPDPVPEPPAGADARTCPSPEMCRGCGEQE